jgi:peptidyl-prolyl cis-trans isomerase B (cyclophilin B)
MPQTPGLLRLCFTGLQKPVSLRFQHDDNPPQRDTDMIIIRTTFGDISVTLDAEKAPKTVENFLNYAREGFYDGTIFHRVIDNFMIQGGGFDTNMQQKTAGEPIENEADNGLTNDFGTIAMARTMDPHSATAQFFINIKDNDFLNHSGKNMQGWGYAVFGKVTAGEDVLNKIRVLPTTSRNGHQDVPVDPVIIEAIEIVEP